MHQLVSAAPVIICDDECVDWRNALKAFSPVDGAPAVIFLSRGADDSLWSEMLGSGAFDLLPRSCEPDRLRRVVCAAFEQRRARQEILAA